MKKKLLKLFKILLLSTISLLIIAIAALYFSFNEPIPKGVKGSEADNFAVKIQNAINHKAFLETDNIEWTFRNKHHYQWHKSKGQVRVQWDTYTAYLDLKDFSKSTLKNQSIVGLEKQQLLDKALAYFNNDSFWVVAPHKLFDPGVTRELVTLEDNTKGLLVNYTSGGTTPGDTYLWKVNDSYQPVSYQMWVSILPIGGIEATWEDWKTMSSGAYLSQHHSLLGFGIPITNLSAWNNK